MYMHAKCTSSIGIGLRSKCLVFCAVVLLLLLFLGSCGSQYKNYDIIVDYQVPFADSNPKWNQVELLEEDEYGRKIFSYKSLGHYTNVFGDYVKTTYNNAPVLLYVVVQKSNNRYVYCYDSLCYTYVSSFDDDSTVIENLKLNNDWGKALDDGKMTALSIDTYRDKIVKYLVMSVEDEAVTFLEQKIEYQINDYYLDAVFLEDGTPIFVLREVLDREQYEFGKSFVFYISEDSSDTIYLELSDEIENWNEEINNFKTTLLAE